MEQRVTNLESLCELLGKQVLEQNNNLITMNRNLISEIKGLRDAYLKQNVSYFYSSVLKCLAGLFLIFGKTGRLCRVQENSCQDLRPKQPTGSFISTMTFKRAEVLLDFCSFLDSNSTTPVSTSQLAEALQPTCSDQQHSLPVSRSFFLRSQQLGLRLKTTASRLFVQHSRICPTSAVNDHDHSTKH